MLSTLANASHRPPTRIVQGYLVANAIRAVNESIREAGAKTVAIQRGGE